MTRAKRKQMILELMLIGVNPPPWHADGKCDWEGCVDSTIKYLHNEYVVKNEEWNQHGT